MPYSIVYFHPRVLAEIESWPVDILADYESQQTPDRELKLARKRMKEVIRG